MRRFIAGLIASLLSTLILVGLPAVALIQTVTSQPTMTAVISSPTIYQAARDAVNKIPLQDIGAKPKISQTDQTPVDKKTLNTILDRYFGLSFYQQTVQTVLTGVYDWLNAKTSLPTFSIKIASNPAEFRSFITDALTTRYQNLPRCTKPVMTNSDYNPLDAKCRDPKLSSAKLSQDIQTKMRDPKTNQLFGHATISSAEIFKNIDPATTSRAQTGWRLAKLVNLLVLVAILIMAGLLILALPSEKRLNHGGRRLVIPAGFSLILALGLRFGSQPLINKAVSAKNVQSTDYLNLVKTIVTKLVDTWADRWIILAAIIAGVGILLIITHHLFKKHASKTSSPADSSQSPNQPAPTRQTV